MVNFMKDSDLLVFKEVSFKFLITDLTVRKERKEDAIVIEDIDNVGAVLSTVSVKQDLCIIVQIDEPISKDMLKEKLNSWTKILEQRNNVCSAEYDRLPVPENYTGDIYYREDSEGNMKSDRYVIELRIISKEEDGYE